jgi:hypothetical protein
MRERSIRGPVTALALLLLIGGCALAACSGGGASSGGGADASEAAAPEAGTPDTATSADSSVSLDATLSDAAPDAQSDAGPEDSGPTLLDFDAGDCSIGPVGEPTDLACTGLYSDWPSKTVSSSLAAYTPGLVFWSDGAQKSRWIYLPPGQQINTADMDEWTFPVGTRIWKEFQLPVGDGGAETRVETRLLWKLEANLWYRTTYRWSADGVTSATELTTGELDAGGIGYEVPTQAECNTCHSGRLDGVLGLEAVSMSAPAAAGLTMAALTSQGLLTSPPDASITVPGDAIQSAALGWLHSNCGTACHNSGAGVASETGFHMRLDIATLTSVQTTDTWTTGWGQQTTGFPIPGQAVTYRFEACNVAASAAYYRPDHRNGVNGTPNGTQMPPIDTHKVDDAGVALVAAWINEGCDAGDYDAGD